MMSLAELEAAAEWLGRNRLREHLHLLEGDHRFGWAARNRQGWIPPVGRAAAPSLRRVSKAVTAEQLLLGSARK